MKEKVVPLSSREITVREEIWGPEKFVNHNLDEKFEAAKKDPARPKDIDPAWWMLESFFEDTPFKLPELIMEIPFRLKDKYLRTRKNLKRIFSNHVLDEFTLEHLPQFCMIKFNHQQDLMFTYEPEERLKRKVYRFYSQAIKFVIEESSKTQKQKKESSFYTIKEKD